MPAALVNAEWWQVALMAMGVATLAIGMWLLGKARQFPGTDLPGSENNSSDNPGQAPAEPPVVPPGPALPAGPSVATRLARGLVVLVLGYHLLAWGMPGETPMVHVPRAWWWALVLLLGALAALARGIDKIEERM